MDSGVDIMNWQHIRYFEVAAEEQHFIRASKMLNITQPALSMAIRMLEEELDAPLFIKTGRNIKLPSYGQTFLKYVKNATASIDEGIRQVQGERKMYKGRVNIVSLYTFSVDLLGHLIYDFQKLYPESVFVCTEVVSTEAVSMIESANKDLGFCTEMDNLRNSGTLNTMPILEDEIVLYVPESHPLANEEYIDFKSIGQYKLIGYPKPSGYREMVLKWCKEEGVRPTFGAYASNAYTIISYVRNGLGITFLPVSPSISLEGVKIVRFREKPLRRNIYMVWSKTNYISPTVSKFREFVIEALSGDWQAKLPGQPAPLPLIGEKCAYKRVPRP
jgi:DNA-binding transcriptional LysR family regulator